MNPPITPKTTADPDPHTNGGGTLIPPPPPPENLGGKRQRRPSVRLGDIGDQTYDPLPNRRPRKGPRSRNPLENDDERERESNNTLVSGWRKPKTKGGVRSNWAFPRGDDDDDVADEDMDDDEEDEARDSPLQSLDNRVSDTDTRNNNYWNGGEGERNGIRVWLNQLGLGRYAPVFEIHEVDDEVLPMLTIEDLRDMGINAVGSRRKMFCAIQKLSKGFS